ncbi:MAG: peptidase and in kexin sedolisin [Paenibacillus sp.]|nr:peptidase and in kexin sedolisin [Paenibacillus sp.]
MNDAALLRLLQAPPVSSKEPAKKHIIHFKTKSDYLHFINSWNASSLSPAALPPIQPIELIHAISCSLSSIEQVDQHPGIRCIEEDILLQVHAPTARLVSQKSGGNHPETASVPWGVKQIKAPESWSHARGNRIKIGVIDTGIDYMHPDLRGRISRGVNLIHKGSLPTDDNGHGTHISGTIAASNSYSGLVGVAPMAMIHPVKVFDHNGTAFVSDIVLGIDWCVHNRMHIINMSFGMRNRSKSLHDAVRNAFAAGISVVASSGNDGRRSQIDYPARFVQTIAVGATTKHKRIAAFSNRGKAIDIYAPGDKVYSTWLERKYMELSGTSMATSHVSGVIALMLTLKPELTPKEIKALLRRTSNPITGLRNKEPSSCGEIDAVRVLKLLKPQSI